MPAKATNPPCDSGFWMGVLSRAIQDGANELRSDYLLLSQKERERVSNFVADAQKRDKNPESAPDYTPLETLQMVLWDIAEGVSPEDVMAQHAMSREQFDRLIGAWETIRTVDAELWTEAERTLVAQEVA